MVTPYGPYGVTMSQWVNWHDFIVVTIGSNNALSPTRHQTITRTNLSQVSFKKLHLKMSSVKRQYLDDVKVLHILHPFLITRVCMFYRAMSTYFCLFWVTRTRFFYLTYTETHALLLLTRILSTTPNIFINTHSALWLVWREPGTN